MAVDGSSIKKAIAVSTALIVLTISAQIKPLAGTPLGDVVPGTLQTFALLVAAAWMGGRLAALTALLYVLVGAAGAPVFSGWQARPGLDFVLYPFAGYLIGFVPAAAFVGWASRRARGFQATLGIMLSGHIIVIACGFLVLLAWNTWQFSLEHGVLQLLPGMAVKTLLAATVVYLASFRLARKTSSSRV
jgi:biotin transport system substrate-specific component